MNLATRLDQDATVTCLNGLLRGELSAVETYSQALEKPADDLRARALRALAEEHREAAEALSNRIRELGGEPSTSSGAWGVVARTAEGAAKLLGPNAAMRALREGEELGAKRYENALCESDLDPESRALIHCLLLPKTQAHLATIDRFLPADEPLSAHALLD